MVDVSVRDFPYGAEGVGYTYMSPQWRPMAEALRRAMSELMEGCEGIVT